MSIKKSVFLSDQSEKIIKLMSRDDVKPQWSGIINQTLSAADWVFRSTLPDLTSCEWQVLLNVYAGSRDVLQCQPYRIASDMMDDRGLIDVEDHPDAELVKSIHGMTQAEQFAILTFVQIFWANDWNSSESFDDIVKSITGI